MTEPVIELLADAWASLEARAAAVPEAGWELATDCPGWTVRDQVVHVVGGERELMGEEPPPAPGAPPAHVRNAQGERNERWIVSRRSWPGPAVLEELREVTATRQAQLRALDAAAWEEVVPTPVGPMAYRDFMAMRAFDAWVHDQDIRRALAGPAELTGPVDRFALERLLGFLPYVIGRQARAPEGATVVVEVGGAPRTTATVEVSGGRARPVPSAPADPTVRIRLDAEDFARLACGRWDAEEALRSSAVGVEGDVELGERVVRALNVMI